MASTSKRITQHPLFPAVVTMWFGATFGLCSLVIGEATLEGWVAASGLSNYIAAAQPPLGSTARVLLALAACAVGAMLGLALAAMLVSSKSPESEIAVPAQADRAGDDIDRIDDFAPALEDPVAEAPAQAPAQAQVAPDEEPEAFVAAPQAIEASEPERDALAEFLRADLADDPDDRYSPRAPFSVFDELGPDVGIAPFEDPEELADEPDEAVADPEPQGEDPLTENSGSTAPPPGPPPAPPALQDDAEPAPDFAGSPPLPSNVHAIDAARMAQRGLPISFANDSVPEPQPTEAPIEAPIEAPASEAPAPETLAPEAPAEEAPAQDAAPREREDLSALSYLQLTERLGRAIARNPSPPENLRRRAAPGGAETGAFSPGLERLREVHARTAPTDASERPDAEDIRNALSGLRNIGGAA